MEGLLDRYAGKTVLVVGAHPDDGEVGAGGTLAKLARAGAKVLIAAVSAPSNLEMRAAEARVGAEALKARALMLFGEKACRIEDLKSHELVARIDELLCEYRPAVLFTHARDETHWDHFMLSRAVAGSLRLGPTDLLHFNNTAYRNPCQQWQPRLWVDISSTIDAKLESIAAHQSQFAARGKNVEVFRDIARERGRELGVPYAEAFDVLRLNG